MRTGAMLALAAALAHADTSRRHAFRPGRLAVVRTLAFDDVRALAFTGGRLAVTERLETRFLTPGAWAEDRERLESGPAAAFSGGRTACGAPLRVLAADGSVEWKPAREAQALAWSPDGSKLAAASVGDALVWTKGEAHPRALGHGSTVHALAWSPDGTKLATSVRTASVTVWDVKRGAIYQVAHAESNVVALLWAGPDLLAGCHDGRVRVFNPENGAEKHVIIGHGGPVFGLAAVGPQWIVTAGGRTLRVRDARTYAEVASYAHPSTDVSALAVSADRRWIATTGADSTVYVWTSR